MSDQWIEDRANELMKSKYGKTQNETGKIIKKAIDQGIPINKIVIGVEHDQAIILNLGRFKK